MFSIGTLVNVPHFRGKALLVVGSEAHNTRCLWSSDDGEWGEVLVPTSLLREVQSASASPLKVGDTLPADWLRKQPLPGDGPAGQG
jgi:hypothetical protein